MDTDEDVQRAARSWFQGAPVVGLFAAFEARYLDPFRRLFVEVALEKCPFEPLRVLDIGCGTGSGLVYLRQRLPNAELVGLDPEIEMVKLSLERLAGTAKILHTGIEALPGSLGHFDLILSYSNLRLWHSPIEGIRNILRLLEDHGLGYLLDLRCDLDPALRLHLLEQLDTDTDREFMRAQIDAAYTSDEIAGIMQAAGAVSYQIAIGGLGGYPIRSSHAFSMLQRNEHIAEIIFGLSGMGFQRLDTSESVFHLFIQSGESSHAEK